MNNTRMLKPLPAVATSSIEAALVAAWEVGGQEAVDAAERSAEAASEHAASLAAELAGSGRVAELRTLLVEQHQAAHRHHYLASLAAGEEPDPLPRVPEVDAELVLLYARAHPGAFARLVGSCDAAASAADAREAACATRMEVIRQEYLAGALDLAGFTEAFSRELGEQTKHREQASRLRAAASGARSALERDITQVLVDPAALRTGLRECLSLARQTDPVISQLVSELESIDADLARLGLGLDDQAEPGAIAATLQAQRESLAEQIKSRRRESAGQTVTSAGELIALASKGDAAALAQIVATVRSKPIAFQAGLDSGILEAMGEALAESSPAVFAELLLMS